MMMVMHDDGDDDDGDDDDYYYYEDHHDTCIVDHGCIITWPRGVSSATVHPWFHQKTFDGSCSNLASLIFDVLRTQMWNC
jgi:hypothetical protein